MEFKLFCSAVVLFDLSDVLSSLLSCVSLSATRWLQILRDGFDSRLEPIAFDIHTAWLLRQEQESLQSPSTTLDFPVQYDLKIASVVQSVEC